MPGLFDSLKWRRVCGVRASVAVESTILFRQADVRCRSVIPVGCTPFAATFARNACNSHLAAIADEEGNVTLLHAARVERHLQTQNIAENCETQVVARSRVHDNAIYDVEFASDDTWMITAAGDRTAKIFSVRDLLDKGYGSQVQPLLKLVGHSASVRCARPHIDDPHVVATCGRDGQILIWDLRRGASDSGEARPVQAIRNAHQLGSFCQRPAKRRRTSYLGEGQECQHSVASIQWLRAERMLVSVGATDGCLKVWDLRASGDIESDGPAAVSDVSASWHKAQGPEAWARVKGRARGLSHVELDGWLLGGCRSSRAICSCHDGNIYAVRLSCLQEPPVRMAGHDSTSSYTRACLSPDGKLVASGSKDGRVLFWNLAGCQLGEEAQPCFSLEGHCAEVSVVRWGHGFADLLSVSDEGTARIWGPRGV